MGRGIRQTLWHWVNHAYRGEKMATPGGLRQPLWTKQQLKQSDVRARKDGEGDEMKPQTHSNSRCRFRRRSRRTSNRSGLVTQASFLRFPRSKDASSTLRSGEIPSKEVLATSYGASSHCPPEGPLDRRFLPSLWRNRPESCNG